MNRLLSGRTCAAILVAMVTLITAACDRAQLLAPTDSEVSLTASTAVLSNSGSTVLTAFVTESSGTPVQNGTTVRFTTSLGRLEAAEAQTRNGVATTTLFADGASGTATVKAVSGSAVSDEVTITMGAAATGSVAITATPSTVSPSGGTVTISSVALDANGNRLVGVPVTFTTTAGTLSSSVGVSDQNGEARVQLTTNRAATVTAVAGGKTANVTVNVAVSNSITLAVTPTSATVNAPVALTVTPTTGANNLPARVVVNWGDGTQEDLGIVATARTVSHVYGSPGTYTIVGSATSDGGESTSASAAVTINPRQPISVTVAADNANPAVNTPVTFTATTTGDATTFFESYVWTVDGQTVTTSSNKLTRVFGSTGTKTVSVTASTTDGRSASSETQIVVKP